MNTDEKYMRIALGLAARAEGLTNPNPLVGAVVVKGGRIIGRGYHKKCGLAHAEVNALNDAGRASKGATLYVTLEPCDHFGRTPPCSAAVIKSGIKRVVIGMKDPNRITSGRGIKRLKNAGIKTVVGVLTKEAESINRPYIKFITKKIPYVTIKAAQSLDGKIATRSGDSKWISAEDSRRYVHELRGKVDAVMVGFNTLIKDDPVLLSKVSGGKQPIRIIADTHLKTPLKAKVFSNSDIYPVIIATTADAASAKIKRYEKRRVKLLFSRSKNGRIDLKDLLLKLGKAGVVHLLVEGGGELAASFVEEALVDRFLFFIAPKIIGGRTAITAVEGLGVEAVKDALILKNIKVKNFAKDVLIEAEAN